MSHAANNFRSDRRKPLIGITMDVVATAEGRLKVDCGLAYASCVEAAGGVPVMLPPIVRMIGEQMRQCDGFILTGGDDPKMEAFGVPTHPKAKVIHPRRQEYELALLEALEKERPRAPVLGVCLGMQLMSLRAGGRLDQFLPDTLATHAMHKNSEHAVVPERGHDFRAGRVWSNHRQAMVGAGRLAVVARSEDGVIEAVRDLARHWYLGVQWHPERTAEDSLGQRILNDLVSASSH
jgi:putative glutamine amidotransferase